MLEELTEKKADTGAMAERALENHSIISTLVEGLTAKNEYYRYNCSNVLQIIGQKHPELLYPYWDNIVSLLDSDNSYHRMSAVYHISNMITADEANKFDSIFGKYFRMLDDRSVIVSIYVAQAAGKIALARPNLQKGITDILLAIDKTHHLPGHKELIKAGIIESFDKYMADYPDKSAIFVFVQNQIESDSPKTRNLAKAFIKKWDRRHKIVSQ